MFFKSIIFLYFFLSWPFFRKVGDVDVQAVSLKQYSVNKT